MGGALGGPSEYAVCMLIEIAAVRDPMANNRMNIVLLIVFKDFDFNDLAIFNAWVIVYLQR